jgi:hypothetical protein
MASRDHGGGSLSQPDLGATVRVAIVFGLCLGCLLLPGLPNYFKSDGFRPFLAYTCKAVTSG